MTILERLTLRKELNDIYDRINSLGEECMEFGFTENDHKYFDLLKKKENDILGKLNAPIRKYTTIKEV